jgi:hypothetical protein
MLFILFSMAIPAEISIESYTGDSLVNKSSGFTFFDDKLNFYLKIEKPIFQKFFYFGDTLLLFYPEVNKAFYFPNYNPMNLPISQILVGNQKDFDLSRLGFRFLLKKKCGDTICTHWILEKDRFRLDAHLKILDGKLQEVLFKEGEKIVIRTIYEDYVRKETFRIPSKVVSYSYFSNSQTKEIVRLSNIKFVPSYPDSLKNFQLPEEVEIQ